MTAAASAARKSARPRAVQAAAKSRAPDTPEFEVAVIGAGNTAVDAATQARRLGARRHPGQPATPGAGHPGTRRRLCCLQSRLEHVGAGQGCEDLSPPARAAQVCRFTSLP